jgi:hypothetical protein
MTTSTPSRWLGRARIARIISKSDGNIFFACEVTHDPHGSDLGHEALTFPYGRNLEWMADRHGNLLLEVDDEVVVELPMKEGRSGPIMYCAPHRAQEELHGNLISSWQERKNALLAEAGVKPRVDVQEKPVQLGDSIRYTVNPEERLAFHKATELAKVTKGTRTTNSETLKFLVRTAYEALGIA